MAGAERQGLLLLAGAWGAERELPVHSAGEPGWHMPAHVRQPAQARRRLVEQVGAGADAIVAPSFWTSRPALARYGEARRAREWTELAVRLAREAADEAGRQVLICGSVMPAAEDFEAHAGMLADASVDVLVVEVMASVAEARAATLAAAVTGLPVWSGAQLDSGEWLGEWADAVEPAAPEYLLTYASAPTAIANLVELARLVRRPLGACLTRPATKEQAEALLDRGARVLGCASGATPEALRPLREALDERLEAESAAAEEDRRAWRTWLERAAEWAPGGAALWLGAQPADALPGGFAWTIAPLDDAARMPEDHYRLVVVEGTDSPAGLRPLRLLESGGILLCPAGEDLDGAGRILDRSDDPALVIVRRD